MSCTLTLLVVDGAVKTQLRFDVGHTDSPRALAFVLKAMLGPLAGGREATLRLPVLLPFDARLPLEVVYQNTEDAGDNNAAYDGDDKQQTTVKLLRLAALPLATGRGSDYEFFVIPAPKGVAVFKDTALSKASEDENLAVALRYLAGQNKPLDVNIARAAPLDASPGETACHRTEFLESLQLTQRHRRRTA